MTVGDSVPTPGTQGNASSVQSIESPVLYQHPTTVADSINPAAPPNEISLHAQPIIAPLLPPSQPIAPPTTVTSALPGPIPLANNTQGNAGSTAKLTDEQIDFVRSLWSAKVPATDIARVMEYMREGREGGGQGLMGIDMKGDVKPGMESFSYNTLRSLTPTQPHQR
jgi:hypothetical protein